MFKSGERSEAESQLTQTWGGQTSQFRAHLLVSPWWQTCKQHAFVYTLGSSDQVLGLVPLWVLQLSPEWVCVRVCGVALCCLVCMWRLMVLQSRGLCHLLGKEGKPGPCSSELREGTGVAEILKNIAWSLGRSQNSVKRGGGVESISNLCYSLRCCC